MKKSTKKQTKKVAAVKTKVAEVKETSTGAARQHKYFHNKIAEGWTRIAIWIAPGVDTDKVRDYAKRKWGTPL